MKFFAVYSGVAGVCGHLCVARADDCRRALRAARAQGLTLARGAYAEPLSVQAYADMLRSAGLKVCGVPEQLQLMEGRA